MYMCLYLKEKVFTQDDILYHKKLLPHDSTYPHLHSKQPSLPANSLSICQHKHENTQKRQKIVGSFMPTTTTRRAIPNFCHCSMF